uniref:Bm7917 n=1 Tax=Brugia malayi TaxID=6279 RepID=A0A1I9G8P1_BRUMA|nr:Bm7917 [Brugia malayi]
MPELWAPQHLRLGFPVWRKPHGEGSDQEPTPGHSDNPCKRATETVIFCQKENRQCGKEQAQTQGTTTPIHPPQPSQVPLGAQSITRQSHSACTLLAIPDETVDAKTLHTRSFCWEEHTVVDTTGPTSGKPLPEEFLGSRWVPLGSFWVLAEVLLGSCWVPTGSKLWPLAAHMSTVLNCHVLPLRYWGTQLQPQTYRSLRPLDQPPDTAPKCNQLSLAKLKKPLHFLVLQVDYAQKTK